MAARPANPAPESVQRLGRDLIASRRTAVTYIDRPLSPGHGGGADRRRAPGSRSPCSRRFASGITPTGRRGSRACRPASAATPAPTGPLVIESTNPLDVASLKAHLKVQPAVRIDWDRAEYLEPYGNRRNPYTTVPSLFRPGTTYAFTIASGVKDVFGQTAPAAQGQARTDDLAPEYELGRDCRPARGEGRRRPCPVRFTNVTELDAQLWPLGPAEMARFLAGRRDDPVVPPRTAKSPPAGSRSTARTTSLAPVR